MRQQANVDDRRWTQVQWREKHPQPPFFLAVRTTGVYCRPACAGRPKRENVVFYATRPAARAAGVRACKRCRPDEPRR